MVDNFCRSRARLDEVTLITRRVPPVGWNMIDTWPSYKANHDPVRAFELYHDRQR